MCVCVYIYILPVFSEGRERGVSFRGVARFTLGGGGGGKDEMKEGIKEGRKEEGTKEGRNKGGEKGR